MVPGLHGFDLIIVLAIALLIFGPKKLPEIGSAIGKSFKEYRKSIREVNAPEEKEVKTLSAAGDPAMEEMHASTGTAAGAARSAESEAERP